MSGLSAIRVLVFALVATLASLGSTGPQTDLDVSEEAHAHRRGLRARPPFSEILRARETLRQAAKLQDGGITAWEWVGPGNIGGRIRAIAINPTNPLDIIIGSVVGGLWRSLNGGATWAPIDDFLPSLAVTCLAWDPNNPLHIYAGTGEGFQLGTPRIDGSPGAGVYASFDGGDTWPEFGGSAAWADDENHRFVNRIAVDGQGNTLVATNGGIHLSRNDGPLVRVYDQGQVTDIKWTADPGSAFGVKAVAGLMTFCDRPQCILEDLDEEIICALVSVDSGQTWNPSTFHGMPIDTLCQVAPAGSDSLVVADAQSYTTWDIVQIGDSTRVQVRFNVGNVVHFVGKLTLPDTFAVGTPVKLIPSQRTELAVVGGDPRIIFASTGSGGGTLWRSTNGGETFNFVSNTETDILISQNSNSTRAFYTTALWVAPDDPDIIVMGGTHELYRSVDGGDTFAVISDRKKVLQELSPHADHHVLVERPDYAQGDHTLYCGNDGGLHKAVDILSVGPNAPENLGWKNLNHDLGITQFYGGAATTSPTVEWFIGGGQDNGRPRLRTNTGSPPDPNDWRFPYATAGDDIYQVRIDASNPQNPILYAAQVDPRIWKSTDAGSTWVKKWEPYCDNDLNPCLCTICVPPERGRVLAPFNLDESSPNILLAGAQRIWRSMDSAETWLPIRDFQPGSPTPAASAIDIVPSDPETYWVGFDDGTLSWTNNGRAAADSVQWTDVADSLLPAGRMITDIAVNPTNPNEMFISLELPPLGMPIDTVWYTSNGGLCWEPRVGEPPLPRIRVHSIRVHPTDPDRVYIGTDLGVLASEDRGLTWSTMPLFKDNEGPANVEVYELSWQGSEYLIAATNSRGMFRASLTPRGPLMDDIAGTAETAGVGNSEGAAWGDFDNDGDLDVYVTNHTGQPNRLYRNDGGGSFTNVATQSFTEISAVSIAAAWGDYDNDGNVDLYVANAGTGNVLLHNNGNSTFTDLTVVSCTGDSGNSRGVAWADYDNDGHLDLYVVNVGANMLYHNNQNGTFSEVSMASATADSGSGQGVAWGDYDDDGFLDLYVANWNNQPNKLFRNNGNGTFSDESSASHTAGSESSLGVAWGDYDNDGDLDLYVANDGANRLYRNDGLVQFIDVSSVSGTADNGFGRSPSWVDYDNDGDLDLYVSNFQEANVLFRNECCGSFTNVSAGSGVDAGSGCRGVAWADYNADGSLDAYVTSSGANLLYENAADAPAGYHWLQVDLVGSQSNRNGIGARIEVEAGCRTQMREISGGSGLYSQNSMTAEFGFGSDSVATSLEVTWPSGEVQAFQQVSLDRRIVIVENCQGDCLPTDIPSPRAIPEKYALYPNHPNPFNPVTTIRYDLPRRSLVKLDIFDVAGRRVHSTVIGEQEAGRHRFVWRGLTNSGKRAASGIYFYRLDAGGFRAVRKMVLLK